MNEFFYPSGIRQQILVENPGIIKRIMAEILLYELSNPFFSNSLL